MLNKYKGYFLVFGTAFISGFSIFINKFGVSGINPYIFAFLKNAIVALLLCVVILTVKNIPLFKSLRKKQWGMLVLIGIIGGGIPFLLFFKGLSMANAAEASFIHKTMFVWIFILAVVFLKEKIKKEYILAGALLLVGNFLLLKMSSVTLDKGALLVFLATIFWAIENAISKYALRELPPSLVMWARMFFGSIVIFIFLIFSGQVGLLTQLNLQQISWAMITGVVLFGYVATWYTGIKYIKLSEAAIILMLGSPITTALNAISVGAINSRDLAGVLLMILGVIVALGMNKAHNQSARIGKFLIN